MCIRDSSSWILSNQTSQQFHSVPYLFWVQSSHHHAVSSYALPSSCHHEPLSYSWRRWPFVFSPALTFQLLPLQNFVIAVGTSLFAWSLPLLIVMMRIEKNEPCAAFLVLSQDPLFFLVLENLNKHSLVTWKSNTFLAFFYWNQWVLVNTKVYDVYHIYICSTHM